MRLHGRHCISIPCNTNAISGFPCRAPPFTVSDVTRPVNDPLSRTGVCLLRTLWERACHPRDRTRSAVKRINRGRVRALTLPPTARRTAAAAAYLAQQVGRGGAWVSGRGDTRWCAADAGRGSALFILAAQRCAPASSARTAAAAVSFARPASSSPVGRRNKRTRRNSHGRVVLHGCGSTRSSRHDGVPGRDENTFCRATKKKKIKNKKTARKESIRMAAAAVNERVSNRPLTTTTAVTRVNAPLAYALVRRLMARNGPCRGVYTCARARVCACFVPSVRVRVCTVRAATWCRRGRHTYRARRAVPCPPQRLRARAHEALFHHRVSRTVFYCAVRAPFEFYLHRSAAAAARAVGVGRRGAAAVAECSENVVVFVPVTGAGSSDGESV